MITEDDILNGPHNTRKGLVTVVRAMLLPKMRCSKGGVIGNMIFRMLNPVGLLQMRISFLLFVTIIISGCTFWYGVRRAVNIDYMVDHSCIQEALSQVNEVQGVEYRYIEGQPNLTIKGWSEPDQGHKYFYKTSGINGSIYLQTNYKQKTEISQSYTTIGSKHPQEEIDIILPVMKKIEASIGDACGIDDIKTIVTEKCKGVKCE